VLGDILETGSVSDFAFKTLMNYKTVRRDVLKGVVKSNYQLSHHQPLETESLANNINNFGSSSV
jgi:hypothetical protein